MTEIRGEDWFDGIFRAHAADVQRYFLRRAPANDAGDLTADVFTTAWRRREDVPTGAELPWLYRTAGYVLANHRRKGRPVPVAVLPEESDDTDPADLVIADVTVRAAFQALSPRDRRILLLHAWEGRTYKDTAAVMGVAEGTVKRAVHDALGRIRSHLDTRDADPVEG